MDGASALLERSGVAEGDGPRTRSRSVLVLLAFFSLLLVAGVAWWSAAGGRLAAVDLAAVGNGVSCSQGQVVSASDDGDGLEGVLTPAIEATPGLSCSVRLVVVNRGGADVRLERLVVPVMGPRTGAAVQVVNVSPFGDVAPGGDGPDGGLDAVVSLDMTLSAGEVQPVTLHLAFQQDGCNAPGTVVTPSGPLLQVRALGRTVVREPPLAPFSVAGTEASNCPRGD